MFQLKRRIIAVWAVALSCSPLPAFVPFDGDPGTGLSAQDQYSLGQIYDGLAAQENAYSDIRCKFRCTVKNNVTGETRYRDEGEWMYNFEEGYQRIDTTSSDFVEGEFKKSSRQLYNYDGKQMQEWADSNNSGTFGKDKSASSQLYFTSGPYIYFLSPLRQEMPDLRYSELVDPAREADGKTSAFEAGILGRESIRTAAGAVETLAVDVELKGGSFRLRFWADPAKSFLPRRMLQYVPEEPGKEPASPLIDIVIDEYKELKSRDGVTVWVPVKGRYAGINPDNKQYEETLEFEMLDVQIDKGLSAADYLWDWPEGAMVVNRDNNDWGYMKGGHFEPGEEFEEMSRQKDLIVKDMLKPVEDGVFAAASPVAQSTTVAAAAALEPLAAPAEATPEAPQSGISKRAIAAGSFAMAGLAVCIAGYRRSAGRRGGANS